MPGTCRALLLRCTGSFGNSICTGASTISLFNGFKKPTQAQAVLRALGFAVKKQDVLQMLAKYDQDASGAIEQQEFRELVREQYLSRSFDDLLERAFAAFDLDGKGKIDQKNLKTIMRDLGESVPEEELQDMIGMFDRDGDGTLDVAEFRTILRAYDPADDGLDD